MASGTDNFIDTRGGRQKGNSVASRPTRADRPTIACQRSNDSVAVTTSDGTYWTWQDLVREFEQPLAAYARSRGIRQPDDVVQDVLVTAVRTLDDFEGDRDNLRSWMFMLAHRRIADRHRRFYRSPLVLVPDHDPTPAEQDDVDLGLLRSEAFSDAMAAFDILSDRQRAVLQMRIIDERSPRDVASELGLSPGNVRVIQCRALTRVRRHLDNRTRTRERTAAGVMGLLSGPRLVTLFRDLGTTLPSDGSIGAWIDHVRTAATTGESGATLATGAATTVAGTAAHGGGATITMLAGPATATGALAVKVGAAGLGIALSVGMVNATADLGPTPTQDQATTAGSVATPTGPGLGAAGAVGAATTSDALLPPAISIPDDSGDLAATSESDDGARVIAGQSPDSHLAAAVSRGSAAPLSPDDAATTVTPTVDEVPGVPVTRLSLAGELLLKPLADTSEIVAALGDTIALADLPRVVDETTARLVDQLDATVSSGLLGTGNGSIDAVVDGGTDRIMDTVGQARDTVADLTNPDATERSTPDEESTPVVAPATTDTAVDDGDSGSVIDDVLDVPIVNELVTDGLLGGHGDGDGLLGLG